jgi:hypothetical protein
VQDKSMVLCFQLRLSENEVLRIFFGPKNEEVAGGWRKLRSDTYLLTYSMVQDNSACQKNPGFFI